MKLSEIASLLNGRLLGDGDVEITGVSGIDEAKEGDITFLASRKYAGHLSKTKASCVLLKEAIDGLPVAEIIVQNPQFAFARLLELFYVKARKPSGVSNLASVSEDVTLGQDVSILPFAYVAEGATIGDRAVIHSFAYIGEKTVIGEGCVIHPHVTLREMITLGKRVIIHAGSVIGADGFGYVFEGGIHQKIPQVGGVIIEDDCEVGANVTIDRATVGNTVIGKGTKIDNLVQIGHNVTIGQNAIIVAQVGIAGSSKIGDFVMLAGQAGVADHTTIEAGTMIGAQSGVMGNVSKGIYTGTVALPQREWLKAQAMFPRLPEMHKRLRELEEKLRELERRPT